MAHSARWRLPAGAPQAHAAGRCEAFQHTVARQPGAVALRTVGGTVTVTWEQYAAQVAQIASGLAALGVRRGDTVALMMTNRPEFHLADTAAFHLGAVPFSVYNTAAPAQIAHVLADAGCQVVVCEDRRTLRRLPARRPRDLRTGRSVE